MKPPLGRGAQHLRHAVFVGHDTVIWIVCRWRRSFLNTRRELFDLDADQWVIAQWVIALRIDRQELPRIKDGILWGTTIYMIQSCFRVAVDSDQRVSPNGGQKKTTINNSVHTTVTRETNYEFGPKSDGWCFSLVCRRNDGEYTIADDSTAATKAEHPCHHG